MKKTVTFTVDIQPTHASATKTTPKGEQTKRFRKGVYFGLESKVENWIREQINILREMATTDGYEMPEVIIHGFDLQDDQPITQTMGRRSTDLGEATYIKIYAPNKRRLTWDEVWRTFSESFPEKWAVQVFPPKRRTCQRRQRLPPVRF